MLFRSRIHEYLKLLNVRGFGKCADVVTVGEMSSTSLENCIGYTNPDRHELTMSFSFHHLKVDYKNGDKWSLMPPDRMALKNLFTLWQEGMQAGHGWNALFWCNHDQPRAVSRFGDEGKYWKESAKMLGTATHMMRGTPYIYQGEEIGMTNAHYTSIDQYRDVESLNYYQILQQQGKTAAEALEILAQRSRDNGRTPMQWDGTAHAGFTTGTPWMRVNPNHTAINAEAELADPDSVFATYRALIALRKSHPVVVEGDFTLLCPDDKQVFAYLRRGAGQLLLVAVNLSGETAEFALPVAFAGTRPLLATQGAPRPGVLRPWEALIYCRDL